MNSFHCLIFLHDKETYINIISNEIISHESKLSLEKILPIPNFLAIISANCFPYDEVVTLEVYIQYFRGRMLDLIIFKKTAFGKSSLSSAFCLLLFIGHKPFKVSNFAKK